MPDSPRGDSFSNKTIKLEGDPLFWVILFPFGTCKVILTESMNQNESSMNQSCESMNQTSVSMN
jgi:hypothetical protein